MLSRRDISLAWLTPLRKHNGVKPLMCILITRHNKALIKRKKIPFSFFARYPPGLFLTAHNVILYLPQSAVNSSELSPQSFTVLQTSLSHRHLPFEQTNCRLWQTADLLTHWNPSFSTSPAGHVQMRFCARTSQKWEQPPPFKQGLTVPKIRRNNSKLNILSCDRAMLKY